MLRPSPQTFAARGDHRHRRRPRQDRFDQVSSRIQHVFAVVDHDQQASTRQRLSHTLGHRAPRLLGDTPSPKSGTNAAVVADTRIWPPWPTAITRAARFNAGPKQSSPRCSASPVAIPIRTGNPKSACALTAASTAPRAEVNAAHTPSPVCLNNQPPCDSTACFSTSSCAASSTHRSGVGFPPFRRALDVGEQERHRPRRPHPIRWHDPSSHGANPRGAADREHPFRTEANKR
jgi:hypothetical protein